MVPWSHHAADPIGRLEPPNPWPLDNRLPPPFCPLPSRTVESLRPLGEYARPSGEGSSSVVGGARGARKERMSGGDTAPLPRHLCRVGRALDAVGAAAAVVVGAEVLSPAAVGAAV